MKEERVYKQTGRCRYKHTHEYATLNSKEKVNIQIKLSREVTFKREHCLCVSFRQQTVNCTEKRKQGRNQNSRCKKTHSS